MKKDFDIRELPQMFSRLIEQTKKAAVYAWNGVWMDHKNNFWVSTLKVINLSVRSFMNKDLQSRSMALTYSTVLAIVPALALLFAICRGFGFQNILQDQLFQFFPSQTKAIETALGFVDSYLKESSQGLFVGVGLIMLLWTLISLLGNIEAAFNKIWDVKQERSFYRKFTDYTALCLMVPILMICSSGVNIFMTSTLSKHFAFLTPMLSILLDLAPLVLSILAFTLSFFIIPNTKVQFKYALLSGAVCGIAFTVLQILFSNGLIYVSKYNAIYGSFAFLPLLLIWLQLSWMILLFGCMLSYSAQNVLSFNYINTEGIISSQYIRSVSIVIMAIIMKRQNLGKDPLTVTQIAANYSMPIRMVTSICDKLHTARLIYYVVEKDDNKGVAPAVDTSTFTLGEFLRRIDHTGSNDFIPGFNRNFSQLIAKVKTTLEHPFATADNILITDLPLPPSEKRR